MRKKTMRGFDNEFQVVHQAWKLAFRREAASFNKALQRTGAMGFSFMSYWFYKIISFGGRALPVPVPELGR